MSIQFIDGNEVLLRGPNTIQMVSNNYYPPVPLPVQVTMIREKDVHGRNEKSNHGLKPN